MVTRANLHGASAGWPSFGNRAANISSCYSVPSSSRILIKVLPSGKTALARRAVSWGSGPIGSGLSDITSFSSPFDLHFHLFLRRVILPYHSASGRFANSIKLRVNQETGTIILYETRHVGYSQNSSISWMWSVLWQAVLKLVP